MNKMKTAAIISMIICIVLATSLGTAVFRYDASIQEKDTLIADKNAKIWDLIENWMQEAGWSHDYWERYTYAASPGANLTDAELKIFLEQHDELYKTILSQSDPEKLKDVIVHISKKPDTHNFSQISDVNNVYQKIQEGFAPHNVLLNPEFEANLNFTSTLEWISTNFAGIPICLNVYEGGFETLPNVNLGIIEIQQAMAVTNVSMIRFVEPNSWYMDHTDLKYPIEEFRKILEFCRNNNLTVVWSEWKISDDAWERIKSTVAGYEDIVTFVYQTNNQFNDPFVGFLQALQFKHWGGSIQSWNWYTTGGGTEREMPVELIGNHTLLARNMGAEIIQFEPYWYFFDNDGEPSEAMKKIWLII